MRTLGEHTYRDWHVERVQETRISVYLFCLFGNTLLTAGVGWAIILFSRTETGELPPVPVAIGMGIVAYAVAVALSAGISFSPLTAGRKVVLLVLLSPLLGAALWPVLSFVLLAPQRRAQPSRCRHRRGPQPPSVRPICSSFALSVSPAFSPCSRIAALLDSERSPGRSRVASSKAATWCATPRSPSAGSLPAIGLRDASPRGRARSAHAACRR